MNEIAGLFEKYSEGQGKDSHGANTVKKISYITGMSTSKISNIRSIEEYAPDIFDDIDNKGMSLHSAYLHAMIVKKRRNLCKQRGTDYVKPSKDKKVDQLFVEEMKEFCKNEAPEYVELIDNQVLSAKEAYDEVVLHADIKKRKKVVPKCECPFCNSTVKNQKIQRLMNLGAEEIEQLLQKLKEREIEV